MPDISFQMNFIDVKNQINSALEENCKYFMTLSEFIYNQMNSSSEQPTRDPRKSIRIFLHNTVKLQLEKTGDIIGKVLDDYQKVLS